ncbi:site-specific integrase [Paenarthrobacter ureafaciens]|uniref:site-specific integrase n=1 Tax=Paenarthrobacter ureafaciens TaxID=37931 RepID=UPI003463AC67
MANDIYRRCGCRDENKKQYGTKCPQLAKDPKHGSWGFYVAAGVDPATGKRRQVRQAGFPTQKAAREARNKAARDLDQGTFVKRNTERYGDYLDGWLERHRDTGKGIRATTYDNYARYIRNDIKGSELGRMMLSDIRRYHLNDFLQGLSAAGRGAVTVRRIAAVLQASLRAAARSQRIDTNPATELELPKVEKKRIQAWQPEQVGHFLDIASHHRLGALFELATFTGLRRGELVGLRWIDVDLTRRQLSIRNNRVQADGRVLDNDTKTDDSYATIDLSERAIGALVAWKIQQDQERDAGQEAYSPSGYVFTMEDGRPLKPQYATRLFEKLRTEAGLPKLTFHGQRHEYASLLISSGEDIAIVQKLLRHSSITITSDIYGHLVGSAASNAAEKAAALVPVKSRGAHTLHSQPSIPA